MTTTNLKYYLGFSYAEGIGPMRFDALIAKHGSIKKAYEATLKNFNAEKIIKELEKKKIQVVTREDKNYPSSLLEISDPPICLYVKGDLTKFDWANDHRIAVVGTRRPTAYGVQMTRKFASELASSGFIVVSGMALGVDAAAHWAAIEVGGRTIAVLGSGVDIVSPASNKRLYDKIVSDNGIVVSEFPPGMTSLPGLFVARNRIVSGLCRGVLVIEGTAHSGSLITAREGVEQGREVFAVPGPLTSEMSAGPHYLLRAGAKLTTSLTDILEEFSLKVLPAQERALSLSVVERKIFDVIKNEAKFVDDIIVVTQIPVNVVLNTLSILEVQGIVEKNQDGRYQVKIT